MKANRRDRDDDRAGAETVSALILFGLFVTVLAILNATSVPAAGLAAEDQHLDDVMMALNKLQADAESTGQPGKTGAAAAAVVPLGPDRQVQADFFSFFLATPAQASGEILFTPDYGNLTVSHYKDGQSTPIVDVGSVTARFPVGRLTFDPHAIFRENQMAQLENGGLVTAGADSATMRFAPPVTLEVDGSTTRVTALARVLNGTEASTGGTSDVRVSLVTEAATLASPASENARNVTLRIETAHGSAWGTYLNRTSTTAGLTEGSHFSTSVEEGAGADGLDVVTWTIEGTGSGNDVRLTTGIAVYRVVMG